MGFSSQIWQARKGMFSRIQSNVKLQKMSAVNN